MKHYPNRDGLPGLERRRGVGDEVQAELDAHFEGTVELLVERGWTEDEAREEALSRFGQVDRYRRTLERIGYARRATRWVRSTLDAVYSGFTAGVRSLRRSPSFAAAVIVSFALGIGANASIFRAADRLLLRQPDGIERPREVRRLYQTLRADGGDPTTMSDFTYVDVEALRRSGMPVRIGAFITGLPETLGEGERAIRVRVARADSAFLSLLGISAAQGRGFTRDDHRPAAWPVAVISHALWRSHFGSHADVLGRTLRVGRGTYEVVGVLPRGFIGALPPAIDVWLPLEAVGDEIWGVGWEANQGILGFSILARLPSELNEEMWAASATATLRTRRDYEMGGQLVRISTSSLVPGSGPNPRFASVVMVSRWLWGVSLLVLLVACANVTNLFLAEGERLGRETALRMAIGAGVARLRVELLVRSLVLALIGAGGALVLATWAGGLIDRLMLADMELSAEPDTGRLIAFTAVVAVVAVALSGLLPAIRMLRGDLHTGLGGGRSATPRNGGLRRLLVVVQTALSTVLIVGSALFVSSLRQASEIDLGFQPDGLVMAKVERERDDDISRVALYEEVEEILRSLPEVSSAARTVAVPFVTLFGRYARLPGEDSVARAAGRQQVEVNGVGADFFATMGIALLQGRGIGARDLGGGAEPVAVVSAGAATHLWPGENPLGKCIVVGSGEPPCARVVGVADEHIVRSIEEQPGMMAWVPIDYPGMNRPTAVMVRVTGDSNRAAARIRRRLTRVPGIRYAEVSPMTDFVSGQMRAWRLGAVVFSMFGLIALVVAAVGLYGILAYDVAQRRREIGIRMALGADRGRLVARVLLAALGATTLGLAAGLLASIWGASQLESVLFRVSALDATVLFPAVFVLFISAVTAAAVPAWRASRVDPREAISDR